MNRKIQIVFVALCAVTGATVCFGQAPEWNTAIRDDGAIAVRYRISQRAGENGKDITIIEDETTTVAAVDFRALVALMMDVARHREFTGDRTSEVVRDISDHEQLIYYYTRNPWPIADSDCVAVMAFSVHPATATFRITAAPTMLESRGVNRMTLYNITFTFKDLGDGTVEITEAGISSPPVAVPLWLIRSAFPKAPADSMRKLVCRRRKTDGRNGPIVCRVRGPEPRLPSAALRRAFQKYAGCSL
jgi:hypothetical protein